MRKIRRMGLVGIHHISLTVTDVEASAAWYQRVLGFERRGEREEDGGERRRVFLGHEGLGTTVALCEHRGSRPVPFDEMQAGLDHVSLSVRDHADLDRWHQRLREEGVTCSSPTPSRGVEGALLIAFRDPDNIQLELFAKNG